jgi:hypothetical protein
VPAAAAVGDPSDLAAVPANINVDFVVIDTENAETAFDEQAARPGECALTRHGRLGIRS